MESKAQATFILSIKAGVLLVLSLLFTSAQAQFPLFIKFPPAPNELYAPTAPEHIVGSYTVGWQDTSGSGCWLSERANGGIWATVPNSSSPIKTINLSRSVGNYEYQVACIDGYGVKLGPIALVGVVTSIPTLDSLATQQGYQFQVRSGHFDGNGKKDIYIQRNSGNTNNGVIYKTILSQTDNGQFEVVENPSSGQLSNVASWPISPGVTAVAKDFNVDGRVDVLLKNLDTAITGVDDQIAYSTGVFFQGAAQTVTAIDIEFEKFFRDTYNWILDPNYFAQAITSNMPAYHFSLDIGVYFCTYWYGFPRCFNVGHALFEKTVTLATLGLSGYETIAAAEQGLANALGFASYDTFKCILACGWIDYYGWYSNTIITFYDVWTPTTDSPGFDDINFSTWARDVADTSEDLDNESVSAAEGLDTLTEIFEQLTGMEVGGICLEGLITDGALQDPDDCRGFELFSVISTIAPEADEVEKRQPNTVYITGHRVGWLGPFHLAVEYNSASNIAFTLSAAPVDGKLQSDRNRPEDISGNIVFGTAESNMGLPPLAHFMALKDKDFNYDDELNYDLFPQSGTDRYNSNSYVSGLTNASNTSSTVDFDIYVGGDKPVPSAEFD